MVFSVSGLKKTRLANSQSSLGVVYIPLYFPMLEEEPKGTRYSETRVTFLLRD